MLQQHELFSMSQEMRKVEHFICYAEALFGPEECIFASPRQWLAITANFFMEDCRQQYQLSCPILHRFCERKKKTCLDPDYIDTFNIYPHEQVHCAVDNIMASSVDPYKKNSLVCLEPYKKNALISVDPNMVDPLLSVASFMVDPLISVDSFTVDPLVESDKGESPTEIILFLPLQSDAPKVQSVKCTGEAHCSDLHTPDPILESSFVPDQGEGYEPTSTALHQPSISLTTIPTVIPQDVTVVASIHTKEKSGRKRKKNRHPGLLAISVDPSYKTVETTPVCSTDIEAQDETVASTDSDQDLQVIMPCPSIGKFIDQNQEETEIHTTAVTATPATSSTTQDIMDTPKTVSTPRLEFLRKQKRNAENKLRFAWNQVMGSIKASAESTEAEYKKDLNTIMWKLDKAIYATLSQTKKDKHEVQDNTHAYTGIQEKKNTSIKVIYHFGLGEYNVTCMKTSTQEFIKEDPSIIHYSRDPKVQPDDDPGTQVISTSPIVAPTYDHISSEATKPSPGKDPYSGQSEEPICNDAKVIDHIDHFTVINQFPSPFHQTGDFVPDPISIGPLYLPWDRGKGERMNHSSRSAVTSFGSENQDYCSQRFEDTLVPEDPKCFPDVAIISDSKGTGQRGVASL
jgi:hypothetical protein